MKLCQNTCQNLTEYLNIPPTDAIDLTTGTDNCTKGLKHLNLYQNQQKYMKLSHKKQQKA